MTLLYLGLGVGLWLLGLHGMLLQRQVLRQIIAINIMGSGVFLVMVALATRGTSTDPILHALVVTGLVVAVSATAFALRLATGAPGAQFSEKAQAKPADKSQRAEPET